MIEIDPGVVCEGVCVNYNAGTGRMAGMYAPSEDRKPGRSRVNGYNRGRAEAAVETAIAAVENYRQREGHVSPVWATPENAVVARVGRNAYVVTFTGTRA